MRWRVPDARVEATRNDDQAPVRAQEFRYGRGTTCSSNFLRYSSGPAKAWSGTLTRRSSTSSGVVAVPGCSPAESSGSSGCLHNQQTAERVGRLAIERECNTLVLLLRCCPAIRPYGGTICAGVVARRTHNCKRVCVFIGADRVDRLTGGEHSAEPRRERAWRNGGVIIEFTLEPAPAPAPTPAPAPDFGALGV